jgi:ABC-type multidrug transport system fused ATPase/permease subunit
MLRIGLIALIFNAIQNKDLVYFRTVVFLSIGYAIYNFVSYVTSRLLRISYMRDTILDVRIAAFDKILNMSYKQFNQQSKDVYISNLINDVNNFEKNFFINLLNFLYSSGAYLASAVIIAFIDWRISLIVLGISVLIFLIAKAMEKKTTTLHQRVSTNNENYTTNLSNTLNGLEILKLNNIEAKFLDNNLNAIDKVERSKFSFKVFSESQRTIVNVVASTSMILIMLYLATQIKNGYSYGDVAAVVILTANMTFGLQNIFPRINVLRSSTKIYEKITKQVIDENKITKVNPFNFNDKIIVQDLSFAYDGKVIFDNANCIIEKGKKYLIKGASGAGKSTFIKILTMSYNDYDGLITVDGQNLKTINDDSFANAVSFIYQDVFLFEDSIKNNITLYKNIKDNVLDDAIIKSGLSDLVSDKQNGLNEAISENGKNLSGGQRQRVSIARAIAKDSQVLFIDEGTSSLNMELGQSIEETFVNYPGTVLSISHRYYEGVSNKYDYVLEIKNGKINSYNAQDYFQEGPLYV